MRRVILAEEAAKLGKGLRESLADWFSLLGVVAATATVVLVPVAVDPEALFSNPGVAYYVPQLRLLLGASMVLMVAVAGLVVFDRGHLGVPVLVPTLVLLGVSALSTLFSQRPFNSLYGDRGQGLLSVAAEVLLFYALARGLTSYLRARMFLAAVTTAAAFVSAYGIAQNYGFDPLSGWANVPFMDFGRSFATIGNPITFAAYLTLAMGAAVALWLGAASRAGRTAWLVALTLIGASWIYAETRGALLGAGIALPLIAFAVHRRMGTVRPLVVPTAVLVVAMGAAVTVSRATDFSTLSARVSAVLLAYLVLVGAFAWLLERGRARLALALTAVLLAGAGAVTLVATSFGILTPADFGLTRADAIASQGDVSALTRLYIWRDTIPMILDRPLLGHGPNNYINPFRSSYMSEGLKGLNIAGNGQLIIVDKAHNHLLQVAATTGLLGLAVYLWVLVSFFRNAYQQGGWALSALSGAVLAYVLQLQTAFPSVATEVVFWGLLGASVALMRLQHDNSGGGERPPSTVDYHLSSKLPGKARGELLAAASIVGLLAVIAVPISLEQREKAADFERTQLATVVHRTVALYERAGQTEGGTYPKAGVYTKQNPIRSSKGRPSLRPPDGVTITTKTDPGGGFAVEGENISLAGTFDYSYDSAIDSYAVRP